MNEMILSIIIAGTPALTAILGVVVVAIKIIKQIKELKGDEIRELKNSLKEKESEMKLIIQDNYELKKEINNLTKKTNELLDEIRLLKRKK